MMTHIAAIAALLFYLTSGTCFLIRIVRPRAVAPGFGRLLFGIGFAAHTGSLFALVVLSNVVFLDNGADYFFWSSWVFASVLVGLRKRLDFPLVGGLAVPLVTLLMGSSSYLLHHPARSLLVNHESRGVAESLLLAVHALPAVLCVVSLALALIVSIAFLVVDRRLRARSADVLSVSGPNLQSLDTLNRRAVLMGFVGITLVFLSGSLWALSTGRAILSFDLSIWSGLVVWILLAGLLHARTGLRWSPRRLSKLTVLVALFFFGSVFLIMLSTGRASHSNLPKVVTEGG
jgi:ABC-type transport system involved in cytochrome c biogenesis permease subunit